MNAGSTIWRKGTYKHRELPGSLWNCTSCSVWYIFMTGVPCFNCGGWGCCEEESELHCILKDLTDVSEFYGTKDSSRYTEQKRGRLDFTLSSKCVLTERRNKMKVKREWGWWFCLPLVYLSLYSPVPELRKLAAGRSNQGFLQLDFLCLLLNLLLSVTGEIPQNASSTNCACFLFLKFLNFTHCEFWIIGKPSSFLGKVWV